MPRVLAFKNKLGAKIAIKLQKTVSYNAVLFAIPAAFDLYDQHFQRLGSC
jgi:hypothetical protein